MGEILPGVEELKLLDGEEIYDVIMAEILPYLDEEGGQFLAAGAGVVERRVQRERALLEREIRELRDLLSLAISRRAGVDEELVERMRSYLEGKSGGSSSAELVLGGARVWRRW